MGSPFRPFLPSLFPGTFGKLVPMPFPPAEDNTCVTSLVPLQILFLTPGLTTHTLWVYLSSPFVLLQFSL